MAFDLVIALFDRTLDAGYVLENVIAETPSEHQY